MSRVLSTNTGKPKSYVFQGVTVQTSMRRSPTLDGLTVKFDRVEGDKFAVPKYHGVIEAVVYGYDASHFKALSNLYEQDVTAGDVGENLTFDSLDEATTMVGDEYEIGSTRLRVSGPRFPCNRLNFTFQRADAMDVLINFRRPGVYFQVLREGHIGVGDTLTLVKEAGSGISVLEIYDGLKSIKDVVAGRLTHAQLLPICEKISANLLVPEFLRSRFQRFI